MRTSSEVIQEGLTLYGVDLTNFVDKAASEIKIYCNIKFIPDELFFEWVDIAYDMYKVTKIKTGEEQSINRVTQGKVSVEFKNSAPTSNLDVIALHSSNLNKFRRVRF